MAVSLLNVLCKVYVGFPIKSYFATKSIGCTLRVSTRPISKLGDSAMFWTPGTPEFLVGKSPVHFLPPGLLE